LAAIADSDAPYAWLIRGFVEAGLPDHSRGSPVWIPTGALNLENFLQGQGAGGILLEFLLQAHDAPVSEDAYSYQVVVARAPEGTEVVVRSEDTLFHHVFSSWGGGAEPPRNAPPLGTDLVALARHILDEVRAHNERFTAWRASGGVATVAQRRGIPPADGVVADRALLAVFETLRRANRSILEGPANRWWVTDRVAAGPVRIEAGLGQEPQYITRRTTVALSPDEVEHAERLRFAGTILFVSAGFSLLVFLVATGLSGWNLYAQGTRWLFAQGWATIVGVGASFVFAGVHVVAGWRLRQLRGRMLVTILTVLGMLPCFFPCCAAGLPAGAWVIYLLRDERTKKVFVG